MAEKNGEVGCIAYNSTNPTNPTNRTNPTSKYRCEKRHLRINKHHVNFRSHRVTDLLLATLVGRITTIIMRTTVRIIITFKYTVSQREKRPARDATQP